MTTALHNDTTHAMRDQLLSLDDTQLENVLHACCESRGEQFERALFDVLTARHPLTAVAKFAAPPPADIAQLDDKGDRLAFDERDDRFVDADGRL